MRYKETGNIHKDLYRTPNKTILEFIMHKCPSLSKVLDNDAEPSLFYCDHCMGWIEPVIEYAGLFAVMDMESRTEPHCRFRVYANERKAAGFAKKAKLLSRPYSEL